jgi:hypothetical protein
MFFLDDDRLLKKLFFLYLGGTILFMIYFIAGIHASLSERIPYSADMLTLLFILAYCFYAWSLVRNNTALRKKYRTGMIVALAAPFVIIPIFKYFLLVPMPTEGLVITFLDKVVYWDF